MIQSLTQRGLCAIAVLMTSWQATAQLSLSMDQALELGVAQAYAMQRARIDVDVAKSDVKELLATGLPQVNASFDFNHFIDIPTQVVPASSFDPTAPDDLVLELAFGTTQSATAGVNATQLVFSGSYLVGMKAAQVFADAKALAVDATEVETRRLVAEAYVTALAAEANVETETFMGVRTTGTSRILCRFRVNGEEWVLDLDDGVLLDGQWFLSDDPSSMENRAKMINFRPSGRDKEGNIVYGRIVEKSLPNSP